MSGWVGGQEDGAASAVGNQGFRTESLIAHNLYAS